MALKIKLTGIFKRAVDRLAASASRTTEKLGVHRELRVLSFFSRLFRRALGMYVEHRLVQADSERA